MRPRPRSLITAAVAATCTLGLVATSAGATTPPELSSAVVPNADPTADPTSAPLPEPGLCPPEPRPAGCDPQTNTRRDWGAPPANSPIGAGSFFSYPNRTYGEKIAIRNRVLNTINSTWGWYTTDPVVTPLTRWKHGSIKMTTWSFGDATLKNALIAARNRGVSVQVVAAASINNDGLHPEWPSLRSAIGTSVSNDPDASFATQCSGACRGPGGAAHSKYFLFEDVGSGHHRNITVQTSMNLTSFAYNGQWNQATVMSNADVYSDFLRVFDLSANKRQGGYLRYSSGSNIYNIFFPGGSQSRDPILNALNQVRCKGATSGGVNGRTRIRLINYAIYQTRGNAIAKKLRSLWNYGCNVRIIYSISSRPVLSILRSRSGRGAIPMKQSVIKNGRGEIVKYNHSKWLAISGYYAGRSRGTWTVVPGSANLADLSYGSDEQHQQIFSYSWTKPYFGTFDKTWSQTTSRYPAYGRVGVTARALNTIPEQPTFGEGIYKYMSEGG